MAKRNFGPLSIIAIILISSALLRTIGVSSQAFAFEQSATKPAEATAGTSDDDERLNSLLKEFEQREEAIASVEARIAARRGELEEIELRLNEKIAEMKVAEKKLRSVLSIASTAAEDDVKRLTSVYESMKPKDAASLFEEMAPGFAAGFLSRMRTDAAAAILSGLTPQTAYAISAILAGRHSQGTSQPVNPVIE
jgi:flagellar motility protein MotE (MotC chaperone)